MKKLNQLTAKIKGLSDKQKAILDACEDDTLTEEQSLLYDELDAERKSTMAQRDRRQQLLDDDAKSPAIATTDGGGGVVVKPPAFLEDPALGFKSTQEFFREVMRQGMSQSHEVRDERLRAIKVTAGSDEAGTYSDPYGGFLVPESFMPNLLSLQAEGDPTAGRTQAVPMTTPTVQIPARTDKTHTSSVSGGLVVYRGQETQAVTASRMEVERVRLTAHPLKGLSYASDELISDSAISFIALLERGFRDEYSTTILKEKIRGTGVGEMEGVLNSPALISVTGAGGAGEIVYEDIIQMRSQCYGYQNAVWLYNHDCLIQLAQLVMPIGTAGVPMWQFSAREDVPDMLMGKPAFPTEHCTTVGTVGDLILCDWSQYLEGTYKQMEMASSMHVRFVNHEQAFRFILRNDGKGWWRSTLTPAQSSTELSPFVAIGTRT